MLLNQKEALARLQSKTGKQISKLLVCPALIRSKYEDQEKYLIWYFFDLDNEMFHVLHITGAEEELTPQEFSQRILCKFCIHCKAGHAEYQWEEIKVKLGKDEDDFIFFE